MYDVEILLQNCEVGVVLNKIGIAWEARNNKRGRELYFSCPNPAHNDEGMKCSMAERGPYKGMFNCWSCSASGNLVQLIQAMGNLTFVQACTFLEDMYGSAELHGTDSLKFRLRMHKPEQTSREALPEFIPGADYQPLTTSGERGKQHREFLLSRRIPPHYWDRYHIGVSEYPKLGDCITIPIYMDGKCVSIFYAQPWKGGLKRYPKNSPQGEILFNYDECVECGGGIMVESILDVLTINADLSIEPPAMACFTNMISDTQLELIRHMGWHGVMPDLDSERGWDLVDRMLPVTGKSLWLYLPPIGKDPGDCDQQDFTLMDSMKQRYCEYESNQFARVQQQTGNIYSIYKK